MVFGVITKGKTIPEQMVEGVTELLLLRRSRVTPCWSYRKDRFNLLYKAEYMNERFDFYDRTAEFVFSPIYGGYRFGMIVGISINVIFII